MPVKKTTLNEVSRAREELEAPSQSPLGRGNFLILKEGQAQGKSLPAVQGSSIRVGIHPRRSKQNMSTGNTRGIQFRNKRNYVGMKYLCVQPEQVSSLFFFNIITKVHIKYIQYSYNYYPDKDTEYPSTPGDSPLLHPVSISPLQE